MNTVLRLRRPVDVRATLRNGARAGGPGAVVHARRREAGDAAPLDGDATAVGDGADVRDRADGDVRDRADVGEASRVTVVARRRLGNAVARNRAKRRLRAAVRETSLPPGFDLVVLARHEALTAEYAVLRRAVANAVSRAVARAEGSR